MDQVRTISVVDYFLAALTDLFTDILYMQKVVEVYCLRRQLLCLGLAKWESFEMN